MSLTHRQTIHCCKARSAFNALLCERLTSCPEHAEMVGARKAHGTLTRSGAAAASRPWFSGSVRVPGPRQRGVWCVARRGPSRNTSRDRGPAMRIARKRGACSRMGTRRGRSELKKKKRGPRAGVQARRQNGTMRTPKEKNWALEGMEKQLRKRGTTSYNGQPRTTMFFKPENAGGEDEERREGGSE